MPMYNLIEYSDNYQDSPATLYQYKRDEPPDELKIIWDKIIQHLLTIKPNY